MGESLSLTLSARLKQALVRQQAEFDSDYATTNLPLTSLIDDSTDPQVFRAAADLLADPRVDRRMLGARILREIKTNRAEAGRLVHEQIGRESDEDVLLWLVTIPRPTSGSRRCSSSPNGESPGTATYTLRRRFASTSRTTIRVCDGPLKMR